MASNKETIDKLFLDRDTSHGGWPEGENRSFRSEKSVKDQILKFFTDMRLLEDTYRMRAGSLREMLVRILRESKGEDDGSGK